MLKYGIVVRVKFPGVIHIFFKHINPVLLIGIGTAFICCGTVLRKAFSKIPAETVNMILLYPVLNYAPYIILSAGLLMVKVITYIIRVLRLCIKIRVFAVWASPSVAVRVVHPHSYHRVTVKSMVKGNI